MTDNLEKIIKYDYDFIINLKDDYINLPKNLEKQYSDVFEIIKKSENYQYIKNHLYKMIKLKNASNYGELDKFQMKIISLLNQLTNDNITKVNKDLCKLVTNDQLLNHFVDALFNKITSEQLFINTYIKLVNNIILNNNFYIDDNIHFYKLLIDMSQETFKLVDNEKHIEQLYIDEKKNIEDYFKKKNKIISNIIFIGNLYNNDLISHEIIDFIIGKLLVDNELRIEMLYNLIKIIKKKLPFNYEKKIKFNFMRLIENTKNSRLKFFIMDLYEINQMKKEFVVKKIIIKKDMKLKNLVKEYINHKNSKISINYLTEFIDNYTTLSEDYLDILFNLNNLDSVKIATELYITLFNKFKIVNENFDENLTNVLEELEDLMLDIPVAKDYCEYFLNELIKNDIKKDSIIKLNKNINLNIN